jgi:hypothetical protein
MNNTQREMPSPGREDATDAVSEANGKVKWGLGIGAFAVASYAILGSVCPLCLIASPALIGAGLFGRAKARRNHEADSERSSNVEPGGCDADPPPLAR